MNEPNKSFSASSDAQGADGTFKRRLFLEAGPLVEYSDKANVDRAWDQIRTYEVNPLHLESKFLVSASRENPVAVAFDVLRTRLLHALKANGWHRVAVTSPTKGCGKTFVAANLAFSIAHKPSTRVVLMDLDLRVPNLAPTLGIRDAGNITHALDGTIPMEQHLLRIAPNLAVGLNKSPAQDPAELLQEPSTAKTLENMCDTLKPDVVIYDLPPALLCDDVLAFLPQVDGVLLVVDGHSTRAHEVRACERLFKDQTELLGVVLNRAEDSETDRYGYYGN